MTRSKSAFTLVEMLVSIAVLVLIMTFIGQMMSSISLSTTLSNKHIDTDNQARIVFDRMAMDFAGMPLRKDIQYLFAKQNGTPGDTDADPSDKMFFFSQAPAFFSSSNSQLFPAPGTFPDPKSDIALIGYCVNTGSNNNGIEPTEPYFLQRLSKGLTWDDNYAGTAGPGGLMFLTFNPGYNGGTTMTSSSGSTLQGGTFTSVAVGQSPSYSGTDPEFDTLATQVFRLEFCFQVKDLTPGGPGGTVFSNYPVAVFTDNSLGSNSSNATSISPSPTGQDSTGGADPPLGTYAREINGNAIHVGDRWFNRSDNMAFVCTAVSPTNGPTWAPNGLADVDAIVVAIAVLDINSRKTLNQTQIAKAASYLPDFEEPATPSSTVPLMATVWQNALDGKSTNGGQAQSFTQLTDISPAAASQIRVYQRFFYLNNN